MNTIADALVYAVTYLNLREGKDDDGDVGALESIAAMLGSVSEEEKDILTAAVERAIEGEVSSSPRPEFSRAYATWMEDLFGEGWRGNKRVSM